MINDDIHNDDELNYPFCRLKLLNEKFGHYMFESTNQNLINEPKVSSQRMRKCYLGITMSPFFLEKSQFADFCQLMQKKKEMKDRNSIEKD